MNGIGPGDEVVCVVENNCPSSHHGNPTKKGITSGFPQHGHIYKVIDVVTGDFECIGGLLLFGVPNSQSGWCAGGFRKIKGVEFDLREHIGKKKKEEA